MGLRWSSTSEASTNPCYYNNLSVRGQVSTPVEQVVWHRILRFNLWCHRSLEKRTQSNQKIEASNSIYQWKIWSWTFVATRRCEVTQQPVHCYGLTQVPRTTPTEWWYFMKALSQNYWHRCQSWSIPQKRPKWSIWNQRKGYMVHALSSCYQIS